MERFAFSGLDLRDLDECLRAIEAAAACGCPGITFAGYRQLRRRRPGDILTEEEARRLAEAAQRVGLDVPCLESHLNLRTFADLDAFGRMVRAAAALGATLIRVRGEAAVLREACQRAEPHGIRLAHMVRHSPQGESGLEVTRRLIERVDRPDFGATWDAQHLFFEGSDYGLESLRALGDRLFAVAHKDARRFDAPPAEPHFEFRGRVFAKRPLGEGEVDFVQVFRDLREVGYRGWHILHRERGPREAYPLEEIVRQTLDAARRIAAQADAGG